MDVLIMSLVPLLSIVHYAVRMRQICYFLFLFSAMASGVRKLYWIIQFLYLVHQLHSFIDIKMIKIFFFVFQTLYTFPDNFRAFKALIAAQYSGADVKISPGFKFGETNKSKSFLDKFPLGKVHSLHVEILKIDKHLKIENVIFQSSKAILYKNFKKKLYQTFRPVILQSITLSVKT